LDKEIKIPYISIFFLDKTIEFLMRKIFILIIFILDLIMFWVHDKFLNGLDDKDESSRPDNLVRLVRPDNPNRLCWPRN